MIYILKSSFTVPYWKLTRMKERSREPIQDNPGAGTKDVTVDVVRSGWGTGCILGIQPVRCERKQSEMTGRCLA